MPVMSPSRVRWFFSAVLTLSPLPFFARRAQQSGSLLRRESYRLMQRDMLLENGLSTRYGLGVQVTSTGVRQRISHGGAVSGYTTASEIYPDDRAAIVVFTNIYPGAAGAASQIASRIAGIIFAQADDAA